MIQPIGFAGRFATYVGLLYDLSELEVTFFAPVDETWPTGDREVQCVLESGGGGGYGPVEERSLELTERDQRLGYVDATNV